MYLKGVWCILDVSKKNIKVFKRCMVYYEDLNSHMKENFNCKDIFLRQSTNGSFDTLDGAMRFA
jgi:hypothetical protein